MTNEMAKKIVEGIFEIQKEQQKKQIEHNEKLLRILKGEEGND